MLKQQYDKKELFEQIKLEASNCLKNAKGSHDFDHTLRVLELALHIGIKEKANLDILKFSAILHDIGRQFEDELKGKICHAMMGAKLSKTILQKYGFSSEMIEAIVHCIETHRFRGEKVPLSKEAKVLFDADKLDSIGAVGIGRAYLFAYEVGAKLHNSKGTDISKTKPYTEEDTAYREFEVKLKHVKEKMLTEEGKRIAIDRHKFMVEYFERLKKEVEGEL